jgi:hypothetical protein
VKFKTLVRLGFLSFAMLLFILAIVPHESCACGDEKVSRPLIYYVIEAFLPAW